jgi:Zn-dependent M16 (insulinase) family peptidase
MGTSRRYFLKAHSITTIGEPSASLADKLEKDEKDRVAATVARLGPAGLAKLTQEITDAQTENDRPIPPAIIKKFDVPDVTLIEWFEVDTARSEGVAKGAERRESEVQKHIDAEGAEVPLFIQFDRA